MRTLTINNKNYSLPGNWNELTTEQLLYLVRLVDSQISAEEIKLKMLLKCLNANVHGYFENDFVIKLGRQKLRVKTKDLHAAAEIFDYLFAENKDKIEINPLLKRNHIKAIKKFKGADDGLIDITYEQFAHLNHHFARMTEQPEAINDFIAVLYRCTPADVIKLPKYHKTLILWYYIGSFDFIQNKFPRVFSAGGEKSNLTVFENQQRIIDALADNDLTKKQAVKKSLLYDALLTLEIAAENAEKLKREMKTKK